MRALSFSQPWLWAVLHAGKHVENRSWAPPIEMIGQRIALHAAKSTDKEKKYLSPFDPTRMVTPVGFILELGHQHLGDAVLHHSAIVGVATIDRVVTVSKTLPDDQKRWFFGAFGWILTDVRALSEPIPATGKLGLWTVPAPMEALITEQLARAA